MAEVAPGHLHPEPAEPALGLQRAAALEQGVIFASMVPAAATLAILERRFLVAVGWFGAAAVLSALGLIHSYRCTFGDTAVSLSPSWPQAAGYAVMALLLLAAPIVTEPSEGH